MRWTAQEETAKAILQHCNVLTGTSFPCPLSYESLRLSCAFAINQGKENNKKKTGRVVRSNKARAMKESEEEGNSLISCDPISRSLS